MRYPSRPARAQHVLRDRRVPRKESVDFQDFPKMAVLECRCVRNHEVMSLERLSPTPRSTPHRTPERTVHDREALYEVLDAGLIGHLGTIIDGSPFVVPTAYGRHDDTVYIHGSTGAQSLRAAAKGVPVCFTVTHVDGIIYARSVFNHSMNYRSAVIHGQARLLTDRDERMFGLEVLTEHLAPGSWGYARLPDKKEDAQTQMMALDLYESSVKVRTGPPGYQEKDLPLPIWAGVLPIRTEFGQPEQDPLVADGISVPSHVIERVMHPART